jgi:hypothetical protein
MDFHQRPSIILLITRYINMPFSKLNYNYIRKDIIFDFTTIIINADVCTAVSIDKLVRFFCLFL